MWKQVSVAPGLKSVKSTKNAYPDPSTNAQLEIDERLDTQKVALATKEPVTTTDTTAIWLSEQVQASL